MGRPKGSANKSTVAAKEALQMAFEGIGGVNALIAWATDEKNQGEFFKLYTKLLPLDLHHSGGLDIALTDKLKEARERATHRIAPENP